MRHAVTCLPLAAALCAAAQAQPSPPHAWLFGAWTGGLYPVTAAVAGQACLGQPTVIFTRDVVLRAQLTTPTYVQRLIVTARAAGGQTELQFTPSVDAEATLDKGLVGLDPPEAAPGFGCENADVLHVRRLSDTEIAFPGCKEFPEKLVRCPGSR
jgi:hypothetical protein